MSRSTRLTFKAIMCLLVIVASSNTIPGQEAKQDERTPQVNICWIYKDVPGPDEEDTRSHSERIFQPYFIYPASQVDNVTLADRLAATDLEEEGKGTLCEFGFKLGAGTFAGVKFIPGGADPGTRAGIDIHRELRLTEATPVYLTFLARTSKDARVNVAFRVGATSGPRYRDSLRFPVVANPSPTRLNDQWQKISIPLQGKDLTSVICPLDILVKAEDNPRAAVVDVYVDDLKFEVRNK